MTLQQSLRKCHRALLESKNIIICTHEKPDGDAIGSSLALFHYAGSLGKKVKVILNNPAPPNLEFLAGAGEMIVYNESRDRNLFDKADTIFALDVNDLPRLGDVGKAISKSGGKVVIIDHHERTADFGDINYIDIEASAIGEILYKLFLIDEKAELTKEIAECLYVSILTDTGSFRFDRTGPETHRIVAGLIELGADPSFLYDKIYNNRTFNSMRLEGLVRSTAELHFGGRFCTMLVRREFFDQTDATKYDTEGFVESLLSVKGVEAGVLLTQSCDNYILLNEEPDNKSDNNNTDPVETGKEEIRLSFRSKTISVRGIAMEFGGGGHRHAAGGRIRNCTIDKAKEIVLKTVKDLFSDR